MPNITLHKPKLFMATIDLIALFPVHVQFMEYIIYWDKYNVYRKPFSIEG